MQTYMQLFYFLCFSVTCSRKSNNNNNYYYYSCYNGYSFSSYACCLLIGGSGIHSAADHTNYNVYWIPLSHTRCFTQYLVLKLASQDTFFFCIPQFIRVKFWYVCKIDICYTNSIQNETDKKIECSRVGIRTNESNSLFNVLLLRVISLLN